MLQDVSSSSSLERLAQLAAGLCQTAGVRVALGDRWAFEPATGTLHVDRRELSEQGVEACAGVVAHEVGHMLLSRYNLFRIPEDLDSTATLLLDHTLNATEDARVERWMMQRFPGVQAWLELAHREPPSLQPGHPAALRFLLATLVEFSGRATVDLPGPIRLALETTRVARQQLIEGFLPPTEMSALQAEASSPEWVASYQREVIPALKEGVSRWPPPAVEMLVRVQASRAARVAVERVFPVVLALHRQDVAHLGDILEASPTLREQALLLLARGLPVQPLVYGALAQPSEALSGHSAAVEQLAERLLGCCYQQHRNPQQRCPGPAEGRPMTHGSGHRAPTPGCGNPDYDLALRSVSEQVERLTEDLARILRRRRGHLQGGFETGQRLDLRRAMRFEADRRQSDLWQRVSLPDRRRAAFLLQVDLSGSMRGPKSRAALEAVALFAETLSRLDVPFAIDGFQDVRIPFVTFDEPWQDGARCVLGQMLQEVSGTRPGGNNIPQFNDDGLCLREAASKLLERPEQDRILLVLSDGRPAGCRSDEEDLQAAVKALASEPLALVGLGVGPGTEHVTEFYPEAQASIPPERLAATVAGLLERCLVCA